MSATLSQAPQRMVIVPTDEHNQDLAFMRTALEEAARAPAIGEVPIAAVIVRGSQILAQAHNCRELWQDPTAHAEMIVIREAAKALGSWRLIDTTLYVTLELRRALMEKAQMKGETGLSG